MERTVPKALKKRMNVRVFALLAVIFFLFFVSITPASSGSPKVEIFDGSMKQVFDATVTAIIENWKKVKSSDLSSGTIEFHTGMSLSTWGEDCTVHLRDVGGGKIEVSLQLRNSAQLYAWRVGNRIAQKLFQSVHGELSKSSPVHH